jgi:radical SAM-linked protein
MSAERPFAHAVAPLGGASSHVLADDPERRFRLRCRYVETGRLAFLSHLEVAATLERVVRRARLPFAVSRGFSPHMKIAYGAALPVGIGSVCEIFDVTLTDYVPADQARAALRAATVPDLMIEQCAYVEPRAKAASVAYPFSTYEVRLSRPVDGLVVPDEVRIVRKRKERVLATADYLRGSFVPGPFVPDGPLGLADGVNGCGAGADSPAAATGDCAESEGRVVAAVDGVSAGGPAAAEGALADSLDAAAKGTLAGSPNAVDGSSADTASACGNAAASAVFHFTLEAKPTGSLRPDVLLRACLDGADDVRVLSVTRVEQRAEAR